ncbi:hypothetical protein C1646_757226 [Rhizophagus diaphanus]|nr:hypothetical protein C1646_757226 [Rhizophagus diaphanus] [Rhizophagus sp. MUCL 43196]
MAYAFMLLNDYRSLNPQTEHYLLDILKITFSFNTTIIMFGILIVLMNNTFEEIYKNAVPQRTKISVNIGILSICYFNCIIYKALTEEVVEWSKEKGNIQTTDEIT